MTPEERQLAEIKALKETAAKLEPHSKGWRDIMKRIVRLEAELKEYRRWRSK